MRHFIEPNSFSLEEQLALLDLADRMEADPAPYAHLCDGRILATLFYEPSTRTRLSFESAMLRLGGKTLGFAGAQLSSASKGETVEDTARVLSRFCDGIMIRTYEQKEVEDLANYGSIPIINGLTDFCHPCQVLADLMTIREKYGVLKGLKMCYIGDGNNMANSLIVGCLKVGMSVSIACPNDYQPDQEVLDFAAQYGDKFQMTDKPLEAAKDADVVITDVWASMGQEGEAETRKKAFHGYQINDEVMAQAHDLSLIHI